MPNAAKDGLQETKIGYLKYPLASRTDRFPMPGGGLFSTADDLSRFCRMVAAGGEFEGQRILSEKAIKDMTSKQTPETLKDGYGVGWSTDGKSFGHGGALATNMTIDATRGLITIWLVQHQGFPGEGGKAHGVFKQAAEASAQK
jgi:CubicO group peptidase (beta-lactamase class C family)